MTTKTGRDALPLAAMGVALAVAAGALAADARLAGFERIAGTDVPLTGREVALPLPRNARPADLRMVLTGTLKCSYNGRTYDALKAAGESGAFREPHEYVRWAPEGVLVAGSDADAHRYVFTLPAEPTQLPGDVSAWVNIDAFVRDLIITPSGVRQSLRGDLRLELWQMRPRPSPALALGLVVALGLMGLMVLRARRKPAIAMADVAEITSRIDRKYEAALKAIRTARGEPSELRLQLERLRDGARELTGHIAAFRRAAATVDRTHLAADIARTERQLDQADRDDVRREIESTLEVQRKLHRLLADADANESRYLLRLSRIESTIDSTVVRATGQDRLLADERSDDEAIAEIETELQCLDEAIAELKFLDSP